MNNLCRTGAKPVAGPQRRRFKNRRPRYAGGLGTQDHIKRMKIAGVWQGEFNYDIDYDPRRISRHPVPFVMILESVNSGVNFRGIVHDNEEKGGFPESGKIEGLVMDDKISFLKKMPQAYTMNQYDLLVPYEGPGPEIIYKGEWLNEAYLVGTWTVLPFQRPFLGRYSAFQGVNGTWWAEKLD